MASRGDYTPQSVGDTTEDEDSPALRGGPRAPDGRSSLGRLAVVLLLGGGGVLCVTGLLWAFLTPRPDDGNMGGPGESADVVEAARVAAAMYDKAATKWRWVTLGGGHMVPKDEGLPVETTERIRANKCTQACEGNPECHYVTVCQNNCYMKKKNIGPYEESVPNKYCNTYVYTDIPYIPGDASLNKPSSAPKLTFYIYRTQGPPDPNGEYPLANVNAASIGGVLWYLQNEMTKDCTYGGVEGQRRFGATRIRRFKITMKATQPLYDRGMNFGKLCSFDSGECTGPHRRGWAGYGSGWNSKPEWDEFGFFVGCGNLGEYPHTEWPSGKRYPNAVWYHLAGPCPTMNFHKATPQCNEELPGGLCDEVTGQGNCTYKIESAGELDIDEVVGIKPHWNSRADFCRAGCKEADPNEPITFGPGDDYNNLIARGCTAWWGNIWDPLENKARVDQVLDAFHRKYPEMPKEQDMPPPRCDFSRSKYFSR